MKRVQVRPERAGGEAANGLLPSAYREPRGPRGLELLASLKEHFQKAGFEEMRDYVDGFQLMKEQEGGRKLWGGDLFDEL